MSLSGREAIRYHRQIIYPGFGEKAQNKLKEASVLIVGIGGLGSPVAQYLASAGVGKITLLDSDIVELSNLNRQILHWETDVGSPKVDSAVWKIRQLNSLIETNTKILRLTSESALRIIENFHLVIDCLDNRETRMVLNEVCWQKNVPLVHGGVVGLRGQITVIMPKQGPCLECIFYSSKEVVKPFPIIGATAGIIGSLQALEAIKILTHLGKPLVGEILFVDCEKMEFKKVRYEKRPNCRVCSEIH